VEAIEGTGDVAAIAAGPPTCPWRALVRGTETAIEMARTGAETAWFGLALQHISTHPSGRIWAGAVFSYLALFALEGAADRDATQ
jgi:hypothetical protein